MRLTESYLKALATLVDLSRRPGAGIEVPQYLSSLTMRSDGNRRRTAVMRFPRRSGTGRHEVQVLMHQEPDGFWEAYFVRHVITVGHPKNCDVVDYLVDKCRPHHFMMHELTLGGDNRVSVSGEIERNKLPKDVLHDFSFAESLLPRN